MTSDTLLVEKEKSLSGLASDIERLETIFETWDETPRNAVMAYRRAIEDMQGEAFRRLIRSLREEPSAARMMKEAVADEIVYAVLRRHEILKPSLSERVEQALDGVRPMLASHGGDVDLVSINPPAVEVRFTGACDGCPASALTFHAGVKKAIQEACPEITDILQSKGRDHSLNPDSVRFVSPFAAGADDNWHAVGELSAIPEGGVLVVEVEGENVILSRQGSMVFCYQNACAHLGLEIDGGSVENGIITCPFHGFQYDLSSGECLTAPEVQLAPHAARVTGDRVEIRLSR